MSRREQKNGLKWLVAASGLVCVMLTVIAPARSEDDTWHQHYSRGRDHLEARQYPQALAEFDKAYRGAPSERRAVILAAASKTLMDAYASGRQCLAKGPDFARWLSRGEGTLSAETRAELQGVQKKCIQMDGTQDDNRTREQPPPRGGLEILCTPADAALTIEGPDQQLQSYCPWSSKQLTLGPWSIAATSPGHAPARIVVTVVAGQVTQGELHLARLEEPRPCPSSRLLDCPPPPPCPLCPDPPPPDLLPWTVMAWTGVGLGVATYIGGVITSANGREQAEQNQDGRDDQLLGRGNERIAVGNTVQGIGLGLAAVAAIPAIWLTILELRSERDGLATSMEFTLAPNRFVASVRF